MHRDWKSTKGESNMLGNADTDKRKRECMELGTPVIIAEVPPLSKRKRRTGYSHFI